MFSNRNEAGRLLAERILGGDIVCAIPRGGVPVAAPIADKLGVPLSIIAVKKVTNPADPEYALGAAGAELTDIDEQTPKVWVDSAKDRAHKLEERFGTESLEGTHVILVDDGAATGRTFLLAIDIAYDRGASKVTVALPVASNEASRAIRAKADAAIILDVPEFFASLSQFYEVFDQTSDEEVKQLLDAHTG